MSILMIGNSSIVLNGATITNNNITNNNNTMIIDDNMIYTGLDLSDNNRLDDLGNDDFEILNEKTYAKNLYDYNLFDGSNYGDILD